MNEIDIEVGITDTDIINDPARTIVELSKALDKKIELEYSVYNNWARRWAERLITSHCPGRHLSDGTEVCLTRMSIRPDGRSTTPWFAIAFTDRTNHEHGEYIIQAHQCHPTLHRPALETFHVSWTDSEGRYRSDRDFGTGDWAYPHCHALFLAELGVHDEMWEKRMGDVDRSTRDNDNNGRH